MPSLLGLAVRESGKSIPNAVGEVREAVDFLRYYAAEVRREFDNATHVPLGPIVCISPWNFPLSIFLGQVSAALAAGNPVLAKPAEQTPLIAAEAVRLLHEAGVPNDVVQLLPGRGETVGAALVADPRTRGVLFTGSTDVARVIARTLSQRMGNGNDSVRQIPLIAETGGQNVMIVDSSALPEQVVQDVLQSAFDSAGQRCSALARALPAGGNRGRHAAYAQGRDARARDRQPRSPCDRRRTGNRPRGARQHRAPRRCHAFAGPRRLSAAVAARSRDRNLRATHAHRARQHQDLEARGVRSGVARGAFPARRSRRAAR